MFKKEEEEEWKSWLLELKDQDFKPIICPGQAKKEEDMQRQAYPNDCVFTELFRTDEHRIEEIDSNNIIMRNQLGDESLEMEQYIIEHREIEVEMPVAQLTKRPRMFMDFISIPPRQKNITTVLEQSIGKMNEMAEMFNSAHNAQRSLDTRRQLRDDQCRLDVDKVYIFKDSDKFPAPLCQLPPPSRTLSQPSSKLRTRPISTRTTAVLDDGNIQADKSLVQGDQSPPTKRRRCGTVGKPVRDFIKYPCERCSETGRECFPTAISSRCFECTRAKKGCKPANPTKTLKAKLPAVKVNNRKDRAAVSVNLAKKPSRTSFVGDSDRNFGGALPEPGPSRASRAIVGQNPVRSLPITPSTDVGADYLLLDAHRKRLDKAKRRRDAAENDVARAQEKLQDVVHRLSLAGERLQKLK